MLKIRLISIVTISLLACWAPTSCKAYLEQEYSSTINKSLESAPKNTTERLQSVSTINYEKVVDLAEMDGFLANASPMFTYIERSDSGDVNIIQETSASRNKYKTITPVIGASDKDIYIDCSYIKSEDDLSREVQVGTYCRGQSKATLDSLEDAISDKHLMAYSNAHPWITKALSIDNDCPSATGLDYGGYHVLRCDSGESNELTQDISIAFYSGDRELAFKIKGFEFSPNTKRMSDNTLVFWGLENESAHSVIHRVIDGGN